MTDFIDIKTLNPSPTALVSGDDTLPFYNATDDRAYAISLTQLQSWVLAGGTIDPVFDDVTCDTLTVTGATLSASSAAGTLASLGVSGNLAVDTNTLFVDAANNRVGVGTVTPAYIFDVAGASNAAAMATSLAYGAAGEVFSAFRFHNTSFGGGSSEIQNIVNGAVSAGSALALFTSQHGTGTLTERARFDRFGNLGLATVPSIWASTYRAMQIGQAGALFAMTNDQDRVGLTSNAYFDTTNSRWEYIGTGAAMRYEQDGGAHTWFNAASGTADAAITFTQAMTLDASGNLGLGVAPSAWATYRAIQLGATASAVVDSSGGFGTNYYFDGTDYRYVSNSSVALYSAATGQHRWFTAPSGTAGNAITLTQAMTLDANGNLLVGTAGAGADGISVVNNRNLSFTESAGVSLVNLFRQAGSGGTSLANGYRYSATSNAVASSTGNASAKTAIILAAGSIQFYADLSTTVAAGTNITPTERVRIKRDGQLRFVPLASAPTIDVENGDVYYDSTTNKLRVRAAGAWTDLH
jgi:hypothetical protein